MKSERFYNRWPGPEWSSLRNLKRGSDEWIRALDKILDMFALRQSVVKLVKARKPIRYTGFLKMCPGGRHAWYATNLGYPVRKELMQIR